MNNIDIRNGDVFLYIYIVLPFYLPVFKEELELKGIFITQ